MGLLLIPVDFTTKSIEACRFGFDLARRLGHTPLLLHAYGEAYLPETESYSVFPSLGIDSDEFEEMMVNKDLDRTAHRMMKELTARIDSEIKAGEITDVRYRTEILEGMPEEVITEYIRVHSPALVLMATRGKNKKEFDLVGSVTAEVLDSCRVPVFTVPDSCPFTDIESIHRLACFCNLDGKDFESVRFLMGMFQDPVAEITLFPVSDNPRLIPELNELKDKLQAAYPASRFSSAEIISDNIRLDYERQIQNKGIEMIVVPNKKKNIFSRIFNPSIPHKLLFERDMPMLALPV